MSLPRVFSAVLAVFAILGSTVPGAGATSFPDAVGTVYADALTYLAERDIIAGYADGMVRPELPLNRAEAIKIVVNLDPAAQGRVGEYRQHMPLIPLFIDMDQSAWYAPYIETASERGIVTGYADRSLRPHQFLRVEEAVVLLMRSVGEDSRTMDEPADLSLYIENRSGEWFTSAVNAVIRRNLVMHYGRLRLGTAITRGQFLDMAYRLSVLRSTNVAVYAGEEPVTPVASPVVVPPQPQPVVVATGSAPYASEKYFAITMPTLGISDLAITHPEDPFSDEGILEPLQFGVGHLFSYPGAGGKMLIYGHSSGYPWDVSQFTKIFRQINRLAVGDLLYVTYAGTLYTYEVSYKETVDASNTDPFNDSGTGEELILYTCWPPDSISERYLVHAFPVGAVALQSTGM